VIFARSSNDYDTTVDRIQFSHDPDPDPVSSRSKAHSSYTDELEMALDEKHPDARSKSTVEYEGE
jgi:hypothetical protein